MCVCVFVCVCEKGRETEREREKEIVRGGAAVMCVHAVSQGRLLPSLIWGGFARPLPAWLCRNRKRAHRGLLCCIHASHSLCLRVIVCDVHVPMYLPATRPNHYDNEQFMVRVRRARIFLRSVLAIRIVLVVAGYHSITSAKHSTFV